MIIDQWSMIIDHWSLINDHWSLIIDQWSLISDHWSMIIDQWSMIIDQWSLIIDHLSLIIDQWSLISDHWAMIIDQWSLINDHCSLINDHALPSHGRLRRGNAWAPSARECMGAFGAGMHGGPPHRGVWAPRKTYVISQDLGTLGDETWIGLSFSKHKRSKCKSRHYR